MAQWSLVGTFADRTLARSYVENIDGDWDYMITPKHESSWLDILIYLAAGIAGVMFITWFMLFTFWATHQPADLGQLPTL